MTPEELAISQSGRPATVDSLVADLRALGVEGGDVLLVHTSLSRLGFVAGGAHAVVLALLAAVGDAGTIVVPTHSGHLSDPAAWQAPPVPEAWWPAVREQTPAFDPALTPTRLMGAVVECLRHHPEARRSDHPAVSFAAVGRHRDEVVEGHELSGGLGERSPLGRVHDLDGRVLLLGVGHANNTSLHLAEHRGAPAGIAFEQRGAPIVVDGERRWVAYEDLEPDDSDFARLGADLAATGIERVGPVGAGTGRLMSQRDVVAYGVEWFREHRPGWAAPRT